MNAYQIAGGLLILIAAAMCVPVFIVGTRPRAVHPRPDIDALVESALLEGIHPPAPDAEVTRRIRAHMDAAVAKLRDDIDEWESA